MPEDCNELNEDAAEAWEAFTDSIQFFDDARERYYDERDYYDSIVDFLKDFADELTIEERRRNEWDLNDSFDRLVDLSHMVRDRSELMRERIRDHVNKSKKADNCIHEETPVSMELEEEE
jgi:hypothetical protein